MCQRRNPLKFPRPSPMRRFSPTDFRGMVNCIRNKTRTTVFREKNSI